MSQSKLAEYQNLSPNCTKPRLGTIKAISIHCTAGSQNNTAKQIVDGSRFVKANKKSGASCHYAVGGDGSIAQGVLEENRAWCTSSPIEHHAVTIEVASDTTGKVVNAAAVEALIRLVEDICRRNCIGKLLWDYSDATKKMLQKAGKEYAASGKASVRWWETCNMLPHRYFAAKACPGEYLWNKYGDIAAAVNRRLGADQSDKEVEDMTEAEVRSIFAEEIEKYFAKMKEEPEPAWSFSEGHWAKASAEGIVDGKRPEAYAKRDEVIAILGRNGLL